MWAYQSRVHDGVGRMSYQQSRMLISLVTGGLCPAVSGVCHWQGVLVTGVHSVLIEHFTRAPCQHGAAARHHCHTINPDEALLAGSVAANGRYMNPQAFFLHNGGW